MGKPTFVVLLIVVAVLFGLTESSRILCVFSTPSISHQIVFRALTVALNKRGHELVVITPDPLNDRTLKNYTEIESRFMYDELIYLNYIKLRQVMDWFDVMEGFNPIFPDLIDRVLSIPEFKKIYEPNSGEHFDLIILEHFAWHGFYPLARRFNAPWIGITSLGVDAQVQYKMGSPIMPSHPTTWELGYKVSRPVTFWKRLSDFYDVWRRIFYHYSVLLPKYELVAKKHFGDYGSTLMELEQEMSLMFSNQQLPISHIRPNMPQVIEIGGLHVNRDSTPLPKELQEFLDGAKEGFVYVSLGSNVKSNMLSNATLQAFITAFSKVPYKVLWKFENDALPEKPKNVFTMKWVPQLAVLAHPNIKLFIYQGGLQSTEEAIHNAVPLIGFPVIADQDSQVLKMVSIGVCKKFEIIDVKADELIDAITTITTDPSYKQRMLNLRALLKDKLHDPMENAIWWVEHVIRHKGTPYLRSSTADLPWYQRGDMDIVAFITTVCLIAASVALSILFRIIVFVLRIRPAARKQKTG